MMCSDEVKLREVTISASAHQVLEAYAGVGFAPPKPAPDGRVVIELDTEVLEQLALLDPDIDRAISKLCTGQWGRA